MSKGYEERYLIALLSAVMNQTETPEPMRQVDWDKIFRLADFHHVAHAVYYGIMGLEENIPQSIRQRFFQKYLEAVFRTERLRAGEEELETLLERGKINCFILSYSDMIGCYPIEEMCCSEFLEIGTDKKNEKQIGKLLKAVDFEDCNTEKRGYIYYRVPGLKVFCYTQSLLFSRFMRKYYKSLISGLPYEKGCEHLRKISLDDKYLFMMCRLIDCYARAEVSLGQMIDFWAFYKKNGEAFSWPYIYEKLKKLKIEEFAERLEFLILRWFGTGAGIDNIEVYDAMESYILSKGAEGREISSKLLPLINTVADCYARNRKLENLKKLLKWLFPDKGYMETLYPALKDNGFLLPVYWLIRLIRNYIRLIWNKIKEKLSSFIMRKFPFINKSKEEGREGCLEKRESEPEDESDEKEKATEIP